MIGTNFYSRVLNFLFIVTFLGIFCNASPSSNGSDSISPVSNFETALKASSAHGTIVAIKASCLDSQPCVILVSKTENREKLQKEIPIGDGKEAAMDLDMTDAASLPEGSLMSSSKKYASPLFHLLRCHDYHHNHACIVGLTGFAPDAQHLLRYTAQSVSQFKHIYSGKGSSGINSNIVKRQVVDVLSDRLKSAALSDSGRPFGVQALVVGSSLSNHREKNDCIHHPACLYSIDPSGGWRSWGGHATAVGNRAEVTRRSLWSQINESKHLHLPMEEALKIAMKALLTPNLTQQNEEDFSTDITGLEQLDAFILLLGKQSKCIALDTSVLKNVYQKYISPISNSNAT